MTTSINHPSFIAIWSTMKPISVKNLFDPFDPKKPATDKAE